MLDRIIDLVFRNRLLVIVGFILCVSLGVWRMLHTAVDAFPDTTPVQVQVNAVDPALNPIEIEQQITLPLELAISGLPGLDNVRSISKFGFAQIVATFDDKTEIYDARQLIMERVSGVSLPPGIDPPTLGPISTGLGEIFHYTLSSTDPNRRLDELRTLHDWVVKPELRKIAGVAEINSWGGFERQYHVIVDPDSLIRHDLSIGQVFDGAGPEQPNVGGGQIIRVGRVAAGARRGPRQHPRRDREHRPQGERGNSSVDPGCGRGRPRPRDPARRGHRPGDRRGRPRPRLHADG